MVESALGVPLGQLCAIRRCKKCRRCGLIKDTPHGALYRKKVLVPDARILKTSVLILFLLCTSSSELKIDQLPLRPDITHDKCVVMITSQAKPFENYMHSNLSKIMDDPNKREKKER
jgi:hypothetical protein